MSVGRPAIVVATHATSAEPASWKAAVERLAAFVMALPPVRRAMAIMDAYNAAGGGLLAAGLAYGALFAGLTGLLFAVGVLGFLVPSEADRARLVEQFTGELAPLAPVARDGLANVATNAGAFSILGLVGMAWSASQFYGSLDGAIGRIFARAPARGALDRLVRGLVSVLLLVGGLLSGIVIGAAQPVLASMIPGGPDGDAGRLIVAVGFPLATACLVITAVGILYRVVPNAPVPWRALGLPALTAGLLLSGLTESLCLPRSAARRRAGGLRGLRRGLCRPGVAVARVPGPSARRGVDAPAHGAGHELGVVFHLPLVLGAPVPARPARRPARRSPRSVARRADQGIAGRAGQAGHQAVAGSRALNSAPGAHRSASGSAAATSDRQTKTRRRLRADTQS